MSMDTRRDGSARIVYSTEHGQMCPDCSRPLKECMCRMLKKSAQPATDGVARIRYETKGRKGKGVTVIAGLPMSPADLAALSKDLKQRLGAGGTVKDFSIELQGDHREQAARELRKKGYRIK